MSEMTDLTDKPAGSAGGGLIGRLAAGFAERCAAIPPSLPQLVLRIAAAIPFWKSGLTKWDGFLQLNDSAVYLFQHEFKLHVFGNQIDYPAPALTGFLAASGEIVFPILLVLGLGTRFAALCLLAMTGLIQLTIPDGWSNFHLPWAAMLLAILAYGPGKIAVDHFLAAAFRR